MQTAAASFDALIKETAALVEAALDGFLPRREGPLGRVVDAMRHGALDGGKRLRPFLLIAAADMFDAPRARSVRAACAVEMIHCYSLIHDDLPAMDDSDLRRGRPSVHKAFDEATAILAGDALLTQAFEILAEPETHPDAAVRCALALELARAAGKAGMVGGQMIDIYAEHKTFDLAGIEELQRLKTGALIRFSAIGGGIVGQAGADAIAALAAYAEDLGLAFQIVDDLLDAFGDAEALGKPVGQDADMDKATFVKLLGAEGARDKARALVESAKARLARFGARAEPLKGAADFVFRRKH
ncbi:polyprenyl synthetase family protein [Amphiplicatus metriothermophilus]|uniref:Farnesyl-diphosphate synthase n=1 Tax=Amphiplicatus metriothermophilus TaxID=1519374 RepID=A0A239PVD1_9PROT|nr:farnesyl diphosphate synthase [Amphiplicatus metriothermophilus]MBB5519511.1 farnesyl diphosphate synthase [Amphiplicatus metriothermophilus]SNT74078.1 farnesyl-diphosphate synthase [Amphiplicatus metriothermophilus]